MLRIRMVEEAIASRYAQQQMRCPVHLSIGQEAASVGACASLLPEDKIFSSHRCHGHYLAKGGALIPMLAELHGREGGCCGGRGGSMHLFDDDAGVVASVPIVASNVPLAVGAALAAKQRREAWIGVAFMGDGALEEGVVHESFNFASRHRLPVVFFVENNLYSVYTRLDERQPSRGLERLAVAHSIPATEVDGNDVVDVDMAMRAAVDRARRAQGPSFIVAETYRMVEHCGPHRDDALGYRPAEEVEAWGHRCPLAVLRRRLDDGRGGFERTEQTLRDAICEEIEQAFRAAESSSFPRHESAADHVYAETVPYVEVVR